MQAKVQISVSNRLAKASFLSALLVVALHVGIEPKWVGKAVALTGIAVPFFFVAAGCLSVGRMGAPSMFGVYLIHNEMYGGKELFRVPMHILCERGVRPFGALVASALVAFIFCIGIDACRRLLIAAVACLMRGRMGFCETSASRR